MPEPTRFVANLVASALIAEAQKSAGHRRLYLSGLLGLSPADVFAALEPHLGSNPVATISSGGAHVDLQGIPLSNGAPEAILVPYLVTQGGTDPGANRGTAGFAALLRDELPTGPAPRVLLILDEHPVETVRTAAEDAAELPSLQWSALATAAITGAAEPVQKVLSAVLDDDKRNRRLPHSAAVIATLRKLASSSDADQAGAGLHTLGIYLADPQADGDAKRLASNARMRQQLEEWSSPGQDFAARLRRKFSSPSHQGVQKVLAARTPFGLDYSQFTFDDLRATGLRTTVRPAQLSTPLRTRGALSLSAPGRAFVWNVQGGSFTIALAAEAEEPATATIRWSDTTAQPVVQQIAPGDRDITITASGQGWRFAHLELSTGAAADLAVFSSPGPWAPFESNLDIDVDGAAFRAPTEPQLLALGPAGQVLGQPQLREPAEASPDGESREYTVELGAQTQPIPLLISGTSAGDTGAESPGSDDDEDAPGSGTSDDSTDSNLGGEDGTGEETDEGTGDLSDPAAPAPHVASVAHALLRDGKTGEPGQPTFFVDSDRQGIIFTPSKYLLFSQQLSPGTNGLNLEKMILQSPTKTAFVLASADGERTLEPHSYLDRLQVGDSLATHWAAFINSRKIFFEALLSHGSVHALATGTAASEARDYVAAYDRLLGNMLTDDRFQAEFERIVMCDAIEDPSTGELFIAPTNPVTVQYVLSLMDKVATWLPDAEDLLDRDVASLSPRHLMPCFSMRNTWYESGGSVPFLWRRYRPQSQANPGEHRPGYIARRIEHFLNVNQVYRNKQQILSLAFHEPGDGKAILDALRIVLKPTTGASGGRVLPRLDVTIISSSQTPTRLEAVIRKTEPSTPGTAAVDRALRDRVTVRHAAPGMQLPEFAHLTFVFQSSLNREPAVVDLDSRASTLFVDGLAAAPGRHTEPGRNETTFSWGAFSGTRQDGPLTALIRKTLELVGGMPREPLAPGRTRMPSTRIASGFLRDLYDNSAWVVHLDKLLGLEAFVPDARGEQTHYLVDYEDRADPAQPGLDAITATTRVGPYRQALRRALAELGTPADAALDRFLRLFNGVSGRWALGLVGDSPAKLHERIGLAVAIASVHDLDHGMHDSDTVAVIVPLDEVIDALPHAARPPRHERFCDDLLYLQVPLGSPSPSLRGRLLEVKYRSSPDPAAADVARKQLEQAHRWLLDTFNAEGPGRIFRSRDLSELIRGSVVRAEAFKLLGTQLDRQAFETALNAVSDGDFDLRLDFQAGGKTLHGDFISIEADSSAPAHRQALGGPGLALGHVRLGRPALQSLARGKNLARPTGFPDITFPEAHETPSDTGTQPAPPPQPEPVHSEPAQPTAQPEPTPPAPPKQPGELASTASKLDAAFAKYGLTVEPFSPENALAGPTVIRYRTRTLGKLSITEVERRARDISREIVAPGSIQIGDEPGFVTVDVPRAEPETLMLATVLPALDSHPSRPGALDFVAGVAPSGQITIADLSRLPHLLVAGATGSGKSVFLRGLLVELLRKRTPDQLHLTIVDPKRLDFAPFASSPHLLGHPIISDPDEALSVLRNTLETELAQRQPILEAAGVSSASEFYESGGTLEELPQLVIIVDEFADLVLAGSDRKAFSELIQRYAQLTRAYGIFLVLATQRPSVDVVTGSIKANLSARIAFSLPSVRDSMTILDRGGAEDLLGNGDLLFYRNGRVERLQAPLATLADVRREIV